MMNNSKNEPKIALGTWSWGSGAVGGDQVFGNHLGEAELKAVFDAAMENGLNLWDTATVYGMGVSEDILGAFARTCSREDILLSTKFTPDIAGEGADPVEVCAMPVLTVWVRITSTFTGSTIRAMWRSGHPV